MSSRQQDSVPRRTTALWALFAVPLVASTAALWTHAARYMPFVADDALISLRYSQRLLDGQGLTWTDGERVEGYTNLLWTLGAAGLGALGIDLIDAVRILGVGCTLAIFAALTWAYRPTSLTTLLSATGASLAVAAAGPVAIWAIGGLEQPLYAALLAWSFVLAIPLVERTDATPRRAAWVGATLALLCLTRPDAPLFVVIFAGTVLATGRFARGAWKTAAIVALIPAAIVVAHTFFRLGYYGDWVPNTAHLKARVTDRSVTDGLAYVLDAAKHLWPLVALATLGVVGAVLGRHQRARALLAALSLVAWCGYVVSVGGDIFPAHRHIVPAIVMLAFLAALGLDWVALRAQQVAVGAVSLVTIGALALLWNLQLDSPANRRAIDERWEWDGLVIGTMFRDAFVEKDPLIAITAAGTLPYFSQLRALDMQGLNDRHIALQPPDPRGFLGHDHGDGAYVLSREPDTMTFGGARGGRPKFVSGGQLNELPEFHKAYQQVRFEGHDPHWAVSETWVRRDGRLGVSRSEDELVIPAYLLVGEGLVGEPGAAGEMTATVRADSRADTSPIDLGAGTWRIQIEPPNPLLELSIENRGSAPVEARRAPNSGVRASVPIRVRLSVRAASGLDTSLLALRLTRSKDPPSAGWEPLDAGASRTLVSAVDRPQVTASPAVRAISALNQGEFHLGWSTTGDSFDAGPVDSPRPGQSKITGAVGSFLNSFASPKGDAATGSALSRGFDVPDRAWLELRVGGGDNNVGVRLRDADDGRILRTWRGDRSERLRAIRTDLAAFAGRRLSVEVFDNNAGGWGHVLADEIQLRQRDERSPPPP